MLGPVGWAVIPVDCCQDWAYDCVLSGPSFELLPDLLPDLTLAYDWARDCLIMGLLLGSKTGPLMFLAGTPSGHTGHRIGLSGPLSESHRVINWAHYSASDRPRFWASS